MDIIILITLGCALVSFKIFKIGDYFSPWFITCAVWFAILFMFQFEADLLYPLGTKFYSCLCVWVPIFVFSGLVTYYSLPENIKPEEKCIELKEIHINFYNLLYVFAIVTTPLFFMQIFKVVSQFDLNDIFYNLRLLAIFGDQDYGFLRYSYIVNQVIFVVGLWAYPKIPKWQLATIVVTNLIGQFAIMEKSGIFFLVIATIFVLYEKKTISAKSIAIVFFILLLLFFVINVLLTSSEDSDGMTFIDFFAIYLLSPAVAFERISEDLSLQFGSHTFQTIYLFLNRFGFNYEVNSRLQDFVWVPLPTNVYTVFEPFYRDFGIRGVAFFAFLYGTLSAWVYHSFRKGSMTSRCIYAYIAKILIIQFYNEDFIQNIVLTMQFMIFVCLLCMPKIIFQLQKNKTGSHTKQEETTFEQ